MSISRKTARLIFSLAAILLLIIAYLLYSQLRSLLSIQDELNETGRVKLKLEQTLSAVKDAETAQRGFLLTKDSVFLQPYFGAYNTSQKLLREIGSSIRPSQEPVFNNLQTLVELRFQTFNQINEHYNAPGLNEETRKQHIIREKSLMDSIRQQIRYLQQSEDNQLAQNQQAKERHLQLTPLFGILLMGACIAVLVLSYTKVSQQLVKTKRLLFKVRRLNLRLKAKNYQLESTNKELDSFTFIASHDLREPLRKILTYCTLIDDPHHIAKSGSKTYIQKIKLCTQRMNDLLNDLLHYSQAAHFPVRNEQVDLKKAIDEIRNDLQEEIRQTNASIHFTNLPVIPGQYFQIKQLFENLLSNAIKYHRPHVPPFITIESELVDKEEVPDNFIKLFPLYYRFRIKDNGIGFESGNEEKVFQVFKRLHDRPDVPGTGMGLALCKKIVDNHHGFIQVYSVPEEGTTFEFFLPAESSSVAQNSSKVLS